MFGKLVKHEFRATRRIIPFVFLVTVILAVTMALSIILHLEALIGISLGLLIMMMIAQIVVTFVLVIWRYYKTMCGNEAYLSFTLPIKPQLLLWSKLLVSFVWVALSFFVLLGVVVLIIVSYAKSTGTPLSEITEQIKFFWNVFGLAGNEAVAIPVIIAMLIMSALYGLVQMFFSVSLGSTSKLHKYGIGGPVLIYVILYFVLQIVSVIFMGLIPLAVEFSQGATGSMTFRIVSRNMIEWLLGEITNSAVETGVSQVGLVGLGAWIVVPLVITGLLVATVRIIEKHTSVR
jgi:hypothetical protein